MPFHAAQHLGLPGWALASGLGFASGACATEVNGSTGSDGRALSTLTAQAMPLVMALVPQGFGAL